MTHNELMHEVHRAKFTERTGDSEGFDVSVTMCRGCTPDEMCSRSGSCPLREIKCQPAVDVAKMIEAHEASHASTALMIEAWLAPWLTEVDWDTCIKSKGDALRAMAERSERPVVEIGPGHGQRFTLRQVTEAVELHERVAAVLRNGRAE